MPLLSSSTGLKGPEFRFSLFCSAGMDTWEWTKSGKESSEPKERLTRLTLPALFTRMSSSGWSDIRVDEEERAEAREKSEERYEAMEDVDSWP